MKKSFFECVKGLQPDEILTVTSRSLGSEGPRTVIAAGTCICGEFLETALLKLKDMPEFDPFKEWIRRLINSDAIIVAERLSNLSWYKSCVDPINKVIYIAFVDLG